jgi:hypothetical protein
MKRVFTSFILAGAVFAALSAVPQKAEAGTSIFFGFGTPAPVVYSHPRVVYVAPQPVYYRPAPVYYQPVQQVVYRPGWDRRRWDRGRWDNHNDRDRNHRDHR